MFLPAFGKSILNAMLAMPVPLPNSSTFGVRSNESLGNADRYSIKLTDCRLTNGRESARVHTKQYKEPPPKQKEKQNNPNIYFKKKQNVIWYLCIIKQTHTPSCTRLPRDARTFSAIATRSVPNTNSRYALRCDDNNIGEHFVLQLKRENSKRIHGLGCAQRACVAQHATIRATR